jgi:Mrp family chromosome partitioning ATPase
MLTALRQLENRAEGFSASEAPAPAIESPSPAMEAVDAPVIMEDEPAANPAAVETPPPADDVAAPRKPSSHEDSGPLWMPTEIISAREPPASAQSVEPLAAAEKVKPPAAAAEAPAGALDGLAALLSQPLPERPHKPESLEDSKPLRMPLADSKASPPPAPEDRGQSLSPLEARLKRNAVQDPLAGQMRAFSRKVIQQFSGIQPATVLFVGADVGDHTSIIAAHLAALLAEQRQGDVLLVDADVARRGLSAGFGRDNHRGLAELLGDTLTDGQSPIYPTLTPELSVLPCGRGAFPAATHLETRIPLLLSGLSERWPWIVVQGGAADSALTGAFAGACQGSYLLVRLGQTAPSEAAEALAVLNAAGACILGCVATNAP